MTDEAPLKTQMERVALELIEGRGAHADPLACIEDLSPQVAARKPPGFNHSVFEIVAHLNYWIDYDMKRMRGAPDPYPEHAAESWPARPIVDTSLWNKEVERFRRLNADLARVCKLGVSSWLIQAPAMHQSHERNASAVGALIFQTITHNSYHVGQIVDIRRALGAWPPAKGGDTW